MHKFTYTFQNCNSVTVQIWEWTILLQGLSLLKSFESNLIQLGIHLIVGMFQKDMNVSERYVHMKKFWRLAHCIQSPHQPWEIDEADIFYRWTTE